jgi:hypothetical protein
MTILRLINGSDIPVKPSIDEVLALLAKDGFVELEGDEGPVHVRGDKVIAVLGDARKGSGAGFRIGMGGSAS